MSFSLQVSNGDIILQGGQLSIVAGAAKMLQDLGFWILTEMGSDQYNPSYGSLIDGGVQPDGTVVMSPIGSTTWTTTETLIQQEIVRITTAYQAQQNARVQVDLTTYNRNTLTPDEMLASINGISFQSNLDMLVVNVSVSNLAGNTYTISIPIQGTVL